MQLINAATSYLEHPLWSYGGQDDNPPAPPPHSKWNFGGYGSAGCGAHYGYDEEAEDEAAVTDGTVDQGPLDPGEAATPDPD